MFRGILRTGVWRVLGALARLLPHAPRMTVLVYHSISDAADPYAVAPKVFERQLALLKGHGDIVPLARAFEHAAGKRVERDSFAITFDDGYQDFLTAALPLLRAYEAPATVFVLGPAPDRGELGNDLPLMTQSDLTAVADDPLVTVGSHGFSHRKLSKLSPGEAREDLASSKGFIEEAMGKVPQYLAYPKGSFNDAAKAAAHSAGFRGAVSVVERSVHHGDDLFALPRIQLSSRSSMAEFTAKLTPAADWYYFLWSLRSRARS